MGVDLSILRVRFIPARGYVYGPPDADAGPASPLPPGGALPFQTLGGALHEIVPKQNRFLNPNTPWSHYTMDGKCQQDPQPSDSYDGANVGSNRSWGVVDDTCDGLIQADVVVGGQRFGATTRVFSCCPDFAPDRRPFFSLTDDLADRDQHPMPEFLEGEIADLFVRVFETASTVNLNATRDHGINENMTDPPPSNYSGLPEIGWKSMTKDDRGYVDLLNQREMLPSSSVPRERLGYAAIAREAHAPLCDLDSLIDLLRSKKEYVQMLIRPPFGHLRELETDPGPKPNPRFRDPRVPRDTLNDMRMPPYMRDSDETPLSITYRQYQALMKYIDQLTAAPQLTTTGAGVPRSNGPVSRRISRLVKRLSLKLSND